MPPVRKGRQGGVKQAVSSASAPKAIGAYSAALRAGNLLFVSGQVPADPLTGRIIEGDITQQTRRSLDNLGALLNAAGATFADVVRTTVFLADMDDFSAMNETYGAYFAEPYPARSTVQAARLPRDARIEIDAIALLERP
jgi:2-iminobutanoate/2-iminopropanoate deaminase